MHMSGTDGTRRPFAPPRTSYATGHVILPYYGCVWKRMPVVCDIRNKLCEHSEIVDLGLCRVGHNLAHWPVKYLHWKTVVVISMERGPGNSARNSFGILDRNKPRLLKISNYRQKSCLYHCKEGRLLSTVSPKSFIHGCKASLNMKQRFIIWRWTLRSGEMKITLLIITPMLTLMRWCSKWEDGTGLVVQI